MYTIICIAYQVLWNLRRAEKADRLRHVTVDVSSSVHTEQTERSVVILTGWH